MRRRGALAAGTSALALAWAAPLEHLVPGPFTAHMVAHLGVVAVAAPLLALGIAGRRWDPVRSASGLFAPVPLSALELLVIWGWHAPTPHHAARASAGTQALEQGSFLAVALLLWLSVLGGRRDERRERRATGVLALLLTSMHMTLLGALLALAPRPLYTTALSDQHIGGALMIAVGGATYLVAGLALTFGLLGERPSPTSGAIERGGP